MRGNAQVIAQLNGALKEELTAINQYFSCRDVPQLGLSRVGRLHQEAVD